jgi:hypothetical protein
MEYNQIAKQMVDFQRISFENWFNAVSLMQDQAASSMDMVLGQSGWIPDDSRQSVKGWMDMLQKERVRFKDYMQKGFDDLEKFMTEEIAESRKTVSRFKKQAEKQ